LQSTGIVYHIHQPKNSCQWRFGRSLQSALKTTLCSHKYCKDSYLQAWKASIFENAKWTAPDGLCWNTKQGYLQKVY